MTPEQEREIAQELGLSEIPKPRAEVPYVDPKSVTRLIQFRKALSLYDPLATAAIYRFLPHQLVIDNAIDPRSFCPTRSWAVKHPLGPIPVNKKITAATGIGAANNEQNHYAWLVQDMYNFYVEWGASSVSPPLLWRTTVKEDRSGAVPMIGLIFKFGIRAREQAAWGLLHPATLATKTRVVYSPPAVKD